MSGLLTANISGPVTHGILIKTNSGFATYCRLSDRLDIAIIPYQRSSMARLSHSTERATVRPTAVSNWLISRFTRQRWWSGFHPFVRPVNLSLFDQSAFNNSDQFCIGPIVPPLIFHWLVFMLYLFCNLSPYFAWIFKPRSYAYTDQPDSSIYLLLLVDELPVLGASTWLGTLVTSDARH